MVSRHDFLRTRRSVAGVRAGKWSNFPRRDCLRYRSTSLDGQRRNQRLNSNQDTASTCGSVMNSTILDVDKRIVGRMRRRRWTRNQHFMGLKRFRRGRRRIRVQASRGPGLLYHLGQTQRRTTTTSVRRCGQPHSSSSLQGSSPL